MSTYYKIESASRPELDALKFMNQGEVCEYIKRNMIQVFQVYRIDIHEPKKDGSVVTFPLPPSKTDVTNGIREMLNASVISGVSSNHASSENDSPSLGLNLVSLVIPLVGVILYFCKKNKTPRKAKGCLIYAGIGFGINFLYYLLIN